MLRAHRCRYRHLRTRKNKVVTLKELEANRCNRGYKSDCNVSVTTASVRCAAELLGLRRGSGILYNQRRTSKGNRLARDLLATRQPGDLVTL
eukprot:919609-Prorocentrum_minimum.AAC.1